MNPFMKPNSNSNLNKSFSTRYPLVAAMLAMLLPMFCLCAQAQIWDGGAGDNLWSSVNNWDNNTLPDATNTVSVGLDANVSLDFDTTNSALYLGITNSGYAGTGTLVVTNGASLTSTNVFVGSENASTLQILNGSRLNSIWIYIGNDANGTMTVDNSAVWMNAVSLGIASPDAGGTLILTNGSIMSYQYSYFGDGTCYIGKTGTGTLIADASTVNLTNGSVILGDNDGSSGSLILKNSAVLNANNEGFYVGRNGTGSLTLDASTLN